MDEPKKFEFTPSHYAAAAAAPAGKAIVVDRGPPEPVTEEAKGERTPAEIESDNTRMILARREYAEWHKVNDGPVAVQMSHVDALHAAEVSPDRYVIVPLRAVRGPVTLEDRVASIERRLGPETPEEIEARQKRDADRAKIDEPKPEEVKK